MIISQTQGIKLSVGELLWSSMIFILLIILHSIKSIYLLDYLLFSGYACLIFVAVGANAYIFKRFGFGAAAPILIASSLVVGLMPYQDELPRIYDLLFRPGAPVSGFSKEFARPIGIGVDVLFYVVPTAVIFSMLDLGLKGRLRET